MPKLTSSFTKDQLVYHFDIHQEISSKTCSMSSSTCTHRYKCRVYSHLDICGLCEIIYQRGHEYHHEYHHSVWEHMINPSAIKHYITAELDCIAYLLAWFLVSLFPCLLSLLCVCFLTYPCLLVSLLSLLPCFS